MPSQAQANTHVQYVYELARLAAANLQSSPKPGITFLARLLWQACRVSVERGGLELPQFHQAQMKY